MLSDAVVAQLVEHLHGKEGVGGSIPPNGSRERARVPEWSKGAVCKTVGASLPRFES